MALSVRDMEYLWLQDKTGRTGSYSDLKRLVMPNGEHDYWAGLSGLTPKGSWSLSDHKRAALAVSLGDMNGSLADLYRRYLDLMTWKTVATNLFTNPSFEAGSGTIEVRRNLAFAPTIAQGTTPTSAQWVLNRPANGTLEVVADGELLYTATVASGIQEGVSARTLAANLAAGGFYAGRIEVKAGGTLVGRTSTAIVYNGANLASVAFTYTGEWQTLDIPSTAVAGTPSNGGLFVYVTGQNGGETLRLRRPQIEKVGGVGMLPGPFFAPGMASPDPDLEPSWTGAPNASESVLTGVRVAGVTPVNCVAIRSTRWVGSGQYSMRLIPTGSTPESYTAIPLAPSTGVRTALVTVRLEAPLTGALALYARTLRATTPIPPVEASAPNEAGEYDLRIQFDASKSALFLTHGGSIGSGDVWWDLAAIVEGDYTGPWFDGDTTGDALNRYLWSGTPNGSTSLWQRSALAF